MRVLLITGASSDIGCGIIEKFSEKYDCIWAHYRTLNGRFEEICRNNANVIPIRADFLVEEEVRQMIATIIESTKIPDSIIHLPAMKYSINHFDKYDIQSFIDDYKISVISIVEILKSIIPIVKGKGTTRIVFMLSSCTVGNPPIFTSKYTMVKYALLGLLKELAIEYDKESILINGISPGMIETKFLSNISRFIIQKNAKDNPNGRNLAVSDLLPHFSYLLFDTMDTGQNIVI